VPKPFIIGDRFVDDADDVLVSTNPADGSVNWEVCAAREDHVVEAVRVADEAWRSSGWRDLLPHERARALARLAAAIEANAEELATVQRRENGKLARECSAQARAAAATFRYYAAVCETVDGDLTPPRGPYLSMCLYEPYGVVAAITPFNSPLTLEAQKLAPALAAGNAVVLKPSEVTPSVAIEFARLALDAGLPPGLVNVLPGRGDVAAALLEQPAVRMVSFTGGTTTGHAVAAAAARRIIPAVLELGGKSPHIVFADADLDAAADAVASGIFQASGQSCVAGSRVLVERPIASRFVSALVERARALRVGDPASPDAQMGPLASFAQRERVEAYVAAALAEGGRVLAGGDRPVGSAYDRGAYLLPTVIDGLAAGSRVLREEIFGPVLCIVRFDSEEDLVTEANDTPFGLACGIWTADYRRAWRVARAIEAGTVWVNTYKELSISTPFGGFKQSGLGREKGVLGLRSYQQAKSLYWGLA